MWDFLVYQSTIPGFVCDEIRKQKEFDQMVKLEADAFQNWLLLANAPTV